MPKKQKQFDPVNTSPLTQRLADRIQKHGPISVAEYMALALGDPEHGYYTTQESIGVEGDFITSPEISQMFGEMIGAWLTDVWLQTGKPDSVKLIELGPGRGTLMADVLRTISTWPELKAAVSVHLVETSQRLRQIQFEVLKGWRPTWYDRFEEVPVGVSFIIANEFFDALPTHQLIKSGGQWQERMIDYNPERKEFVFVVKPLDFSLSSVMPSAFIHAPEGSVFEVSPASLGLLDLIAGRIAKYNGAGLIIDYGHTVPGLGDTLQAVSKHQYSNPLENPGVKDITVHVDFATLAQAASTVVRVHGPVMQGDFLTSLGIQQRAEKLCEEATSEQAEEIKRGLERLITHEQMGGIFKVLGLTPRHKALNVTGFNEAEINHEASDDAAE